ncbi:MAG: AarF/UbiB family protein, partial [Deltaproteobacteria bacterium]|nr:AarF/UbiB family protein [Deltaproteobacteria bacterium]
MNRFSRYLHAIGRMLEVNATILWFTLVRLAELLGLRRLWAVVRGHPRPDPLTGPVIVRKALEALGPTYIKFGQLAASSSGFLPDRYSLELSKLLDEVPPVPLTEVRRVIEEDLGGPLETFYAEFDPTPLAAASIAQVHCARLPDGAEVVVKVQRPGISETIERDMHHMRMLTRTLETLFPVVRLAHPTRPIEDLKV